ncbi:DNA-binding transcriptional regulator, LysR family [Pedobacter westerhofensis]|uniref:DNA-binding transcriptional regulator, LysR family n=1 Tax=Pedobacter westerhofensis TaxID=425512 RepID=A0A521BYE2_9SPHI|nr:LysR family transcriptional regulator [Pedobacter westerhofensis]SMO52222.1 DNA-binding transcriptional regulator, LysR family [Pedobacter westerhofensis]
MLNLEWFRTFKVIYEAGTLSAAAQTLFISQPGVSLHLSSLESYTGYRLFERDTRKMVATERGTMLYDFVIDHMNKLEEAEKIFHRKSRVEKPTLGLGMSFEIFQYSLEAHVSELPFNLITRFGDYSQMLQDLNSGVLDLILIPQTGNQHNLTYMPFNVERMVLVCGNQTDTTELDRLVHTGNHSAIKEWLAAQIWYTTTVGMEPLKSFWNTNFNSSPGFRPNYVVPYFSSILKCLSNSKGFALVPDYICGKDIANQLIKLAWEGSTPFEQMFYFGKRKKTVYADEVKQLEDILRGNWALNKSYHINDISGGRYAFR